MKPVFYLLGIVLTVMFAYLAIINGEMFYMLASALVMSIFGIGVRDTRGERHVSTVWQIIMAVYLMGLAILLWTDMPFIKNSSNALIFILFILPFAPFIVMSEYSKINKMK